MINALSISRKGLDFIKGFEAFVPYVYDDLVPARTIKGKRTYREWKGEPAIGTLTIGYGHTMTARARVNMNVGARMTEKEACDVLDIDLDPCETEVNGRVKVALTQGQFDALVSFVFNCGEGAFRNSSILRKLNRGDYAGARASFDLYVNSKGRRMAGLVRRRDGEQALWDSGRALGVADVPDDDASAAPAVPIPDQPVDHPAEVDEPQPKGMVKSQEGYIHAGTSTTGAGMAGEQARAAVEKAPSIDQVIAAKEKAEALGLPTEPLTLWDLVGPTLSRLAHSPLFWVGLLLAGAGLYGFYRRWRRMQDEVTS